MNRNVQTPARRRATIGAGLHRRLAPGEFLELGVVVRLSVASGLRSADDPRLTVRELGLVRLQVRAALGRRPMPIV